MAKPLRVLIVEDTEDDALLIVHHLGKAGFDLVHERVETAKAMRAALQDKIWDVILCDYRLPGFSVANALKIASQAGAAMPLATRVAECVNTIDEAALHRLIPPPGPAREDEPDR